MQKKKQRKPIRQIIILAILAILLLLLIFAEDIIKLTNSNKTALLENTPSQTSIVEPNIPVLSAGMIPIKWNGTNFVITTQEDKDWYDYKNGKPAYIMLNDGYYQSELKRGITSEQLMANTVGNDALVVPNVENNNPTILMWIPRFAINNETNEIKYIKGIEQTDENCTIPEIFTHKQETETAPDFLLTGIWLEKNIDANFTNKIAQMNSEESIYGFIKNTIALSSNQTTQNEIQNYIANTVGNDAPVVPQIPDPLNPNRVILKIINQNNQAPIKAKASYNKDTGLIQIDVTYSQYGIAKILYENTQELKLTKNGNKATATSEGLNIKYGTAKITIIDNKGNTKELELAITSRVYATLYSDGTLAFSKMQNPLPEKGIPTEKYSDISESDYEPYTTPWNSKSRTILTVEIVDEIAPKSTACWFTNFRNLTEIKNISNLNTANVTNMKWMFSQCEGLTNLDVSNFDTSKVTNMEAMFSDCLELTNLDVSNFNTNNVTSMFCMFQYCDKLTNLDVSKFNTSKVTNMERMFGWCSKLTKLDINDLDTANVTNMNGMFRECQNLTSINLSNFNTSNVTDMNSMFYRCSKLTNLNLSSFNTKNVTNMMYMFFGCSSLTNIDLINFDTTNVTDMGGMFCNCSGLTALNLSSFDTDNVTDMSNMFYNCSSLSQITFGEKWDKEITLPTLTKPCAGWYSDEGFTNKVADAGANYTPTGPITIYANVPPDIFVKLYTDGTLAFCSNNSQIPFKELSQDYGNIGGKEYTIANSNYQPWYDRSNSPVKTVQFIDKIYPVSTSCWFHSCTNLTTIKNIENLDTKNVTNMNFMFNYCENLTSLDLSNFNTSKVTDMRGLIRRCTALTSIDLSSFDTSRVTDMTNMFDQCSSLISLDLSNFDTSNVVDMTDMFTSCTNLTQLNLSNFNTSSVTDMASMFSHCTNLKSIDLSSFNTNSVTNISGMFDGCTNLTSLDLSSFDTNKVTSTAYLFSNCSNLTQITFGEKWNKSVPLPVPRKTCTGWYSDSDFTTKVADAGASYMPTGPITIYTDVVPDIYVTLYTDGTLAFAETKNPFPEKTIDVQYEDVSEREGTNNWTEYPWYNERNSVTTVEFVNKISPISTSSWFAECRNLSTIKNIENLDTSKVTNMSFMFYFCDSLTELDLSSFDTSNVTNMQSMFNSCWNLNKINISSFNTSNVTNMYLMFAYCWNLTEIDVSGFDTNKVTGMDGMFLECKSLTEIDVSNFNVSNVTDIGRLFSKCSSLTKIDISNFNKGSSSTKNVTDMNNMFSYCTNLTDLNLGNLDTSNVTNMSYMFNNCNALTSLNLSSFNTSKVTNMSYMFNNCNILTSLNLSSFNTSKVTYMNYMFYNCTNLKTIYVGTYWRLASTRTDMFTGCGTSTTTRK